MRPYKVYYFVILRRKHKIKLPCGWPVRLPIADCAAIWIIFCSMGRGRCSAPGGNCPPKIPGGSWNGSWAPPVAGVIPKDGCVVGVTPVVASVVEPLLDAVRK